jgi:hypothetical protein
MGTLTLNGWIASAAAGVVESVPLQDFESALALAEDFLGTQGGWSPDDPLDPTGIGDPVSGISLAQAIALITFQQLDRIYHTDVSGVLNFRILMNNNLSQGQDDASVLANLVDLLDDIVQENLLNTNIEFVAIPSYTGVVTNGPTDSSVRVNIQNTIVAGGQIIDPYAIALNVARAEYNLDTTHNVEYLYTEPNKALFVMVIKYTDTLYGTVDTTASARYGITLDPISYRTAGGTILPPINA